MKHRGKWNSGAPGRAPRSRKLVPGIGGRVGRTKAPVPGTGEEKPPRWNPGGDKEQNRLASAFDRVAALCVLGLGGRDRQPESLPQGAGQEPTDRVRLPASIFHEFLQGGAAGAPQQVEHLGGLTAVPGARGLLGRPGRPSDFGSSFRRGCLLGRPRVGRRDLRLLCGDVRLFGWRWLFGQGIVLGVRGFCRNAVHIVFSFGGDYRDHMNHSGPPDLQANSDGNPYRLRIGGESEFDCQMGAGGGRC